MDSIELLARFAYQPNALNYCGPSDANKVLRQYIIHKDNTEETKKVNGNQPLSSKDSIFKFME